MPNRYAILLEEEKRPLKTPVEVPSVPKPASPLVRKSANPQADKSARPLSRLSASPQADMATRDKRERYSTRLLPETIKAMKRYALDHDIHDYEVVEQGFKLLLEHDRTKSPQDR